MCTVEATPGHLCQRLNQIITEVSVPPPGVLFPPTQSPLRQQVRVRGCSPSSLGKMGLPYLKRRAVPK